MNGMDAVIKKNGITMKRGVLLSALFLSLMLPAPASAQISGPKKVADVIVSGNRSMSTTAILNKLDTRKGRDLSLATVNEDAKRLGRLGTFRDVGVKLHDLRNGEVNVEFVVREHPNSIQFVRVVGDRHVRLEELDILKRIRKGAPLNYLLNRQAAIAIEDLYREKGYFFVKVKLERGGKAGDEGVVFNICEGPLVRIRNISFTGNKTLASQARLRTQTVSSQAFLGLIGGSTYNPAKVDYDVAKLEEYYRINGYLNVKISRETKFSPDLRQVDLVFHIHEGVFYRVGKITVGGVKNLPQAQVENSLKTKQGQVYNGSDQRIDIQRIANLYGWRGYKVSARPEKTFIEPGLVHVHYQVLDQPRPPAKVGQIDIIGNTVTKERVIRRVLGIYPGQTLRYPELRLAERNLARLNLFEVKPALGVRPTVSVIEDPNNPDSEFKNILVDVRETYTGSFMLGLGVSSDAGLVGNIVLNERNFDLFRPPATLEDIWEGRAFRGAGQEFRLEAVPGTELQRYTISLREPFLFDRPYSLTTSGYYYDRIFREYTERRIGGRVTLGHQFNPNWSVTGGVRLENVRVADVPFFAPKDYLDVQGDNFLVAPRVSLIRDTRDSFLRPSEGNRIEASYEQVLGDFSYPILNLEAGQYFTTFERKDGSGKHILAARGQISWADDEVPVYDRFFAGGYRSLRGFEFRGVGPFDTGFNVGGSFMMLASLEYQIPLMANDNLYAVAFVDSGTVERDVNITDYRVSAGVGLRINVPMMGPVPIALDFGFPIIRGNDDREQLFSFYIGIGR